MHITLDAQLLFFTSTIVNSKSLKRERERAEENNKTGLQTETLSIVTSLIKTRFNLCTKHRKYISQVNKLDTKIRLRSLSVHIRS